MKQCSSQKDDKITSAVQEEDQKSKATGKVVLYAFIGFFCIFASVDAYFVHKAITTHSGVVMPHAYEIGLNYNEVLEKARKRKNDELKHFRGMQGAQESIEKE